MPVLLRQTGDLSAAGAFTLWVAVAGTEAPSALDPQAALPDLAARLEACFDAMRDQWWALGKELAAEPSGRFGHMPTASVYASDFGVTLAWSHLVAELAAGPDTVLVLCDDPWVFRHLATLPGIKAGAAPALTMREAKLAVRGLAARSVVAARMALSALKTRAQRAIHGSGGGPFILVYGHPVSQPDGTDAYFGGLMHQIDGMRRLLHTDCPPARAQRLLADGRSASLHAWGRWYWALSLPFVRWIPSAKTLAGPLGWLVRRSAAIEGGGGSAAMTRWQERCQQAWLDDVRPTAVAWPWENHPWERDFCRLARSRGVRTVGYQHTVIGPHMYNQAPATNPDGLDSFPDVLACNGPAYRDNLHHWGVPADRLAIGGAIRIAGPTKLAHDPHGPIFVGLSNEPRYNSQLMAALAPIAARGSRRFLVKQHPMFPFSFAETENLRRTEIQLQHQKDALAGVLYCTGAIGLEGMLGGLPTLRFRPHGYVAMNVLPPGIEPVPVDAQTLEAALEHLTKPPPLAWDRVFAAVDWAIWRRLLEE